MSTGKIIRDGRVAVLVSPGYGAGWSTWNHRDLCFCPAMVAWVEAGKVGEPPIPEDVFGGGAEQLKIVWVDEGVQFKDLKRQLRRRAVPMTADQIDRDDGEVAA